MESAQARLIQPNASRYEKRRSERGGVLHLEIWMRDHAVTPRLLLGRLFHLETLGHHIGRIDGVFA